MHEERKAKHINEILNLPDGFQISSEQMVLSHTPFKEMAHLYHDTNVLIVGGYDCLSVAQSYGFKKAIHVSDYHRKYPFVYSIFPPRDFTKEDFIRMKEMYSFTIDPEDKIGAVLFMYESEHLGRDLQIVLDLVLTKDGIPGKLEDTFSFKDHTLSCKLYMSNADFLYSSSVGFLFCNPHLTIEPNSLLGQVS